MKNQIFKGSGVAIVTPFNKDSTVNEEKLRELIDFQINGNTDCIVIMGTTGESSTCCDDEHLKAIEICVNHVNKRVPVVAGCGSNDTLHAVALSVKAQQLGVDGLLHVTPYYNKTSQRGLVKHFTTIADAVEIPIILYNVPSRTGMSIQPSTYLELSKHPNIVATKEASGDISSICKTISLCRDNLDVYSGNDDQVVPLMSLGGLGVISVVANVMPETMSKMCRLYFEGKTAESAKIQLDIMKMNDAMFCDVNPIPVKEAMNQMGMDVGPVLLPLYETSEENKNKINLTLKEYGLI